MTHPVRRSLFLSILILAGVVLLAAGCSSRPSQAVEKTVERTVVVTVPVVETRVVVETRTVPQTVVVTATPTPTPAYVSRINVPPDTLTYPIANEPSALSPQGAIDDTSALIAQQLYEGLFNLRADGSTIPAGATGFKASDDGKVYTVTLRAEARWSDGKPVTAQHFVDGICRALEPATGNSYYYLLTDIARITGAKAFASGNTADCKKVGVKAVDDRTLQFSLEQPASFFPKLLSMQIFFPARVDITRTVAGGLVNNGPYTLAESVPGERLALRANPDLLECGPGWPQTRRIQGRPRVGRSIRAIQAGRSDGCRVPEREHGASVGRSELREGVARLGAPRCELSRSEHAGRPYEERGPAQGDRQRHRPQEAG